LNRVPRVNLKQIGAAANVSIATASKILRGKDESSAETRKRVFEAAEKLKYRPNLLVQGMQTGRTQTVGVILPGDSVYQGAIGRGIHDELVARDYVPIQLWVSHGVEGEAARQAELEQIHRLIDRRVDGVVLWPLDASVPERHFGELWDRNIPLVTVDRDTSAATDHVGTDDVLGGELVAQHLLRLGHRHVAHLAGNPLSSSFNARRRGFVEALLSAGATCEVVEAPTLSDALGAAKKIFAMNPRPTAIFAARDDAALRVYSAASEMGIAIGRDVSVVGYGDREYCADLYPPLTSVRQNPYEIGRAAAKLLLELAKNGRSGGSSDGGTLGGTPGGGAPTKIQMKPELVVRRSTTAIVGQLA
jgi:LacI family transcriptional regulator